VPTASSSLALRFATARVLATMALLALLVPMGLVQAEPWTELGPHRVGFRVIETSDPSRTFFGLADEPFALHPKPARPLQIQVWYPAQPAAGAVPMRHREYWALAERLGGVTEASSERRAAVRGQLEQMLRFVAQGPVSDAEIASYLDRERPVVRDAPAEPGRFPLLLSQPARFDAAISEHLASHGYVVAAVDSLGAGAVALDASRASLEEVAGDLEYLLGIMRADPEVDPGRAGAVEFGMVVAPTLLLQMRHQHLDALVSLDGWDGFEQGLAFLKNEPSYDTQAMRVPYMRLLGTNDGFNATRTRTVFDACRYAERWFVSYPGIGHGDFSDDPVGAPEAIARRRMGIRGMARHVLAFFDAFLKSDPGARTALGLSPEAAGLPSGSYSVEHVAALPAPPTERELVAALKTPGGVAGARARMTAARAADPGVRLAPEATLNALGYELLGTGRPADAIAVFRINVELYPDSANVYDSLGEALEGQKLYREAAESYGQAAAVAHRQGGGSAAQLEANRDRAARLAAEEAARRPQ
jgi:hypothetical protein